MKQILQKFVSEISFDAGGDLQFRGQPIQAASVPDADPLMQFTEFVYKYLYTHPSGDIGQAFLATLPDPALLERLADANTTRADVQTGWIVRTPLTDGSVIAERYGKVSKFLPGQFLGDGLALPIQAGSALTVTHMPGSAVVQPGFFHMFGQEQLDLAEQAKTVRLYLNLNSPDAAGPVAECLTGTLNTYKIPFRCKFATRPADYSRTDTAVVYLSQRFFNISQMALAEVHPILNDFLSSQVPMFTRRIMPGIGFAEDPVKEMSFGASRSKLVAEAILSCKAGQRLDTEKFWSAFCAICDARGVMVDALYLNPKSSPAVYFPEDVSEIAA